MARVLVVEDDLTVREVVLAAAVLAGVVATARLVSISSHHGDSVTLVAVASGVVSVAVALALAAVVVHRSRGLREFQALSDELARTSARLEESRLRAERLDESRRELVSWVSHDLRTPLAGMRAMTEAHEDGMAVDPERYHLQIRAEVDRMVRMVDDLGELSRIHAGVLRLSPEPVMLVDLVSEAIAAADPVARAGRVHLGGSGEDGVEVSADPGSLSRVVSNLLMNAIRHTPGRWSGSSTRPGRGAPP